jgi:hypothetical protein
VNEEQGIGLRAQGQKRKTLRLGELCERQEGYKLMIRQETSGKCLSSRQLFD